MILTKRKMIKESLKELTNKKNLQEYLLSNKKLQLKKE